MPSLIELTHHPVWPKILTRKDGVRLLRLLNKEGFEYGGLIASVSGTNDLIVWVRGFCYDQFDEFEFDAVWEFNEKRISHPTARYRLKSLEMTECP